MNTLQKISKIFADKNSQLSVAWPEYSKNATAEWVRKQSGLPWLKLDIEIPVAIIHEEILAIKRYLVAHRTDYNEHTDWSSFCIHGKAFDATREDEYYNDTRPYTWTNEALQYMPNTVRFFRDVWPNNGYYRLRVMELAPGGVIGVHRDTSLPGVLQPVNIAITQPDRCDFYMENFGIVPFEVGSSFLLNIGNRHTVINKSDDYRYHIIIHHLSLKELDSLVLKSYNKSYAS
jgi:hypothetical protein